MKLLRVVPSFIILLILVTAFSNSALAGYLQDDLAKSDTNQVIEYNKLGYNSRLVDPKQAKDYAEKALTLAVKLDYKGGMAEAYRVKGISLFYQNKSDSAIQSYLTSLSYFKELKNQVGIAKVTNNIGNLYRDIDYDRGLSYYQQSLVIAQDLKIKDLLAGLYLNIGIILQKKNQHSQALTSYQKSFNLFNELNNPIGLTSCLQSLSLVYFSLNDLDKAEQAALNAIVKAKENDLNFIVAGTNLTLSKIYTTKKAFDKAEKAIDEGIAYSKIIKDSILQNNYLYNSYQLEFNRKNYPQALDYLYRMYHQDSVTFKNNVSLKFGLLQEQFKQQEKERENEFNQKTNRILFWAGMLVLSLLILVIVLLVSNVRKKAQTNRQLTSLNKEISLQKENLNRINHNLEDIIDERTKDLKIKNKKLSDYSSHLSHQIRGPVATLKGLMNLEKEKLIDKEEFVQQMEKCVNDIDDKILNINDMLHDPQKYGFRNDLN